MDTTETTADTTMPEGVLPVTTPLPPDFNFFDQNFTLINHDGTYSQMTSTLDIDEVRVTAVQTAIVFATQLGASAILLLVLLLMTPGTKRRSLSWLFNVLALVCNIVRCALQCIETTGPFLNFVLVVMQEYGFAHLDEQVKMSIANGVMNLLVFVFIELALVTQVQVICAGAMTRMYRVGILTFCGINAALAIAFRFYLLVINCQNTFDLGRGVLGDENRAIELDWAQSTSNIMAIVSICMFSGVFCTKLGIAIRSRRSLGLKQFGAMQIIFIMGCQTLTVPRTSRIVFKSPFRDLLTSIAVIFAILDYYVIRGAQLGSYVETLVAIFLPLSSMWASTNVKSKHIAMPMNEKGPHRAFPVGHSDLDSGVDSLDGSKKQLVDDSTIDTLVNHTPSSSYNKSPGKYEPRIEPRVSVTAGRRLSCLTDLDDLELGHLGNNIHVDQTYTVLSEPDWNVGRAR